jgi:hypothetical protein
VASLLDRNDAISPAAAPSILALVSQTKTRPLNVSADKLKDQL